VADSAPVFDCVLLAGDDLDRNFTVAGGEEGEEPILDLALGRGDRSQVDQIGGDERALLGA
jgi:hypothetical protein